MRYLWSRCRGFNCGPIHSLVITTGKLLWVSRVQACHPDSSCCRAKPRRTWRRNASSSPTMLGAVIFILPMPTSASSRGPELDCMTEVSVLKDHESGTVYPALCDHLTWTLDSSNDYWRHFCLSETTAHLWLLFIGALCINSFAYLLTYLLPTCLCHQVV